MHLNDMFSVTRGDFARLIYVGQLPESLEDYFAMRLHGCNT